MKDYDFKLLRGFADGQTNRQTNGQKDVGDCRVAFATEKPKKDRERQKGKNRETETDREFQFLLSINLFCLQLDFTDHNF